MAVKPLARRPIYIASFGSTAPESPPEEVEDREPKHLKVSTKLRHDFPAAGESREGGVSDGYRFRVTFAAGRLSRSYEMVREFLRQEGYGELPLPATVEELKAFRDPPRRRRQLGLFADDGYAHNPIKILFPPRGGKPGSLILELYNEKEAGHLLKFHGRGG